MPFNDDDIARITEIVTGIINNMNNDPPPNDPPPDDPSPPEITDADCMGYFDTMPNITRNEVK